VGDGLLTLARSLRAALVGFDPERFSAEVCAELAEELASTENACKAGRVRADAMSQWHGSADRSEFHNRDSARSGHMPLPRPSSGWSSPAARGRHIKPTS
jgi:hypothetical protein